MPHPAPHLLGSLRGLLILPLLGTLAAAQTTHVVDQVGLTFVPQDIQIQIGDTVQWVWNTGFHTVTEGTDDIVQGTEAFHSLLTSGTPSVSITFDGQLLQGFPRVANRYDYVCIFHLAQFGMKGSVTVQSPWSDLGSALGGVSGDPLLVGDGTLQPGSPGALTLSGAAPGALSVLFLSSACVGAPFKGGTLVPVPVLLQLPLITAGAGTLFLPFLWPGGLPPGTPLCFQFAVQDAAAPVGVALSNALQAIQP